MKQMKQCIVAVGRGCAMFILHCKLATEKQNKHQLNCIFKCLQVTNITKLQHKM